MKQKKNFTPELAFAREIATKTTSDGGHQYATDGSCIYIWTDPYWKPIPLAELEHRAWEWLSAHRRDRASPRLAASCAQAAVLAAIKLPTRPPARINIVLPVKNGALEILTDIEGHFPVTIRDAKRDDGLTYCLACNYDPLADSPKFAKFIVEVLPDPEVRDYVQEYIGYTLLPDVRFQRAQFWLGGGANGKSTLAEMVSALHEKPTAMQLDRLEGFHLSGLLGASLVFVDETPSRIDEQKLKALISGGLVQVDRKFRDPISFRPNAKWIICGNSLPAISDQSLGFWRRFPVIPFTAHFPDAAQDPMLAKNIISHELPGILNWAIEGLLRLLKRGRFGAAPAAVMEAIEGGKRETNSVLAWWINSECALVDPSIETPKVDVYGMYQEWCRANGMQALSSPRFWRRLKDIESFGERQVTQGRKRTRVVTIRLQ